MANYLQTKTIKTRRGISMIEYGIIAALIGVFAIATINILSKNTELMYCTIAHPLMSSTAQATYTHCGNITGYGTGANYSMVMNGGAGCLGNHFTPNCTIVDDQFLYLMNKQLGVTSVYGLKDDNDKDITTYDAAIASIQAVSKGETHTGGVVNSVDNKSYQYEFKTSNGDTYGTFWGGTGTYGAVDFNTGETYILNQNGDIQNMGITTDYGNGN